MLDKARPVTDPILKKIAKPFLWVNPNAITIIGFLIGGLFFYLMYKQMYWLALVCFLGVAVDSLDGTIARMTGKESKFGAFFDSSMDRLTDCLTITGFAIAGAVSWPLTTAVVIASFMISYVRGKAEQVGNNEFKLAVGIIERPERIIFMFVMTLLLALEIDYEFKGYNLSELLFILLLILSIVTIVQRFYAAWKKLS